jgi:hypothetical protein
MQPLCLMLPFYYAYLFTLLFIGEGKLYKTRYQWQLRRSVAARIESSKLPSRVQGHTNPELGLWPNL